VTGLSQPVAVQLPDGERPGSFVRYRELLANLVRKELKIKYKNSALGFVWSLATPLLYLVVFSVALTGLLGQGMPQYYFFLLSGLLAWNLFSAATTASTHAIVSNASLVTKIYFRREVLPLSAIGAALVHFLLQLSVLLGAMLVLQHYRFWDAGLLLLPLAVATQVLLLIGMAFVLTTANVYYRDVQHLLEIALLAWFWLTPIVYSTSLVSDRPSFWRFYLMNPMAPIVMSYQRALYSRVVNPADGTRILVDAPVAWYAQRLGYVALLALVILGAGWLLFRKLDGRLADEL
jgi:ABC-2 type transport system permease protein